ncbi:aromatic ring-hydroxylating dioxygenase subunit alpha [Laspinema sp. A4]|uniref:aromatic ring-hydroxylating dioxygenase subunit alpha n=1 Tax=Laspinema sp. D2d TaxID=2953686 RepID=UPI0021BA5C44|nr:aromatic ring-hydroxylating dioxygenase subunit alpha [Laspinema sp. D2d]MCT7982196.1 aromatic ring-hydroxylating dioxygenase subunit alpha [Laspinema sp. D2d]
MIQFESQPLADLAQSLRTVRQAKTFNNPERFIEGWYWAIRSKDLKIGHVKPITLQGRNLAIYRGTDGKVVALDAYCPHMGAHLAEGKVDGNGLRCFFHNWKYDNRGLCVESPGLDRTIPAKVRSWPTAENYGLVWVWTGETPRHPVPYVPELAGKDCDAGFGLGFRKNCHPNVVMINAIDAHHFNTVHNLPVEVKFEKKNLNENAIIFNNITRGGDQSWFIKLIRPLYKNEITYKMCYWYGSTGTVTVGPDFLHFHIMFSIRLKADGKAEGQTIAITEKRSGLWGWLFNRIVLWITLRVGNYFAKGDTQVFETIKFDLKTPTIADQAIIEFIEQVETQKPLKWETWETVEHLS